MTVASRSLRSGVLAAILSLIIATIVFVASGIPIQIEETLISPAKLIIGAAITGFSSATIAVYLTLRGMENRET